MPTRSTTDLATGLSNAVRHAAGPDPTYGIAEQVEDLADRAVLAALAVQHRHHARGRVGEQAGEQAGVHVALGDLEARGPQRLRRTSPGAEGDVALVGEPAGEHDDGVGHERSVPGPSYPLRGRWGACVAPKVSRSSISSSRTPARRRTPSRIRSGVG